MEVLADAITEVQALDMAAQIALCDKIAAEQPSLFGAVLTVLRKKPGEAATEMLLRILMVSFQAMRRSGYRWAPIEEGDWERALTQWSGAVRFAADLKGDAQRLAQQDFISQHPEPVLLAYVLQDLNRWQRRDEVRRSVAGNGDWVMMAALSVVQSIAHGSATRPTPETPQNR